VSAEDQPRAAEHPSGSGEDLSRHELESTKDPFGSLKVPRRWQTRKNHYVAPPPVPQIQSLGRLLNQSVIGNHFLYS
jgi:hypothetical protein